MCLKTGLRWGIIRLDQVHFRWSGGVGTWGRGDGWEMRGREGEVGIGMKGGRGKIMNERENN